MQNFETWLAEQTTERQPEGHLVPYISSIRNVEMHWRFIRHVGHRLAVLARFGNYSYIAERGHGALATATIAQDYDGASMHGLRVSLHDRGASVDYRNLQGKRVLMLEGVTDRHTDTLKCVDELRRLGATVDEIISVIDMTGGAKAYNDAGLRYTSLFTAEELGALLP